MKRRTMGVLGSVAAAAITIGVIASPVEAKKKQPLVSVALTLPAGGSYPEGIAVDPVSKRVFVTSLTDGAIFVAGRLGQTMKTFSPAGVGGRTSAVGVLSVNGRVLVAGGQSGRLYAYDQGAKPIFSAATPDEGSFLNDVAVSDGYVYVTDSFRPILWRAPLGSSGEISLEPWLDLSGQGISYQPNTFNWNGIEPASVDGVLVAVDSASGSLFKIDVARATVTKIDLAGALLKNGDGLVVRDQTIWVVRNSDKTIDTVTMNADWTAGSVTPFVTSDAFAFPTTADIRNGQLLVVNSQLDKGGPGGPGTPTRPFTVSALTVRARSK